MHTPVNPNRGLVELESNARITGATIRGPTTGTRHNSFNGDWKDQLHEQLVTVADAGPVGDPESVPEPERMEMHTCDKCLYFFGGGAIGKRLKEQHDEKYHAPRERSRQAKKVKEDYLKDRIDEQELESRLDDIYELNEVDV